MILPLVTRASWSLWAALGLAFPCAAQDATPLAAELRVAAAAPVTPLSRPPSESVESLVLRGRRQLSAGQLELAEATFTEAVAREDSARTRPWLVRTWIAEERIEDALAATEQLAASGAPEDVTAYLYGMCFRGLAQREVAARGSSAGLFFSDALTYLQRAAETGAADSALFPDLPFALADTAWNAGELDVAARAVLDAARLAPDDARIHALGGKIALAQGRLVLDGGGDASADLERARSAFAAALAATPSPLSVEERAAVADLWIQSGYVELFAQAPDRAAEAAAQAMSWAPESVDYEYWQGALESEAFERALASARERLLARRGSTAATPEREGALLAWWSGFVSYQKRTRATYAAAEADFVDAVTKNPDFVGSWYYIAKSRYAQQNQAGALEALKRYADLDRAGLVGSLASDEHQNALLLEGLVGWCMQGRDDASPPDNLAAAFTAELLTETQPTVARHWSNLGLFLRDAGADVYRRAKREPATAQGLQAAEALAMPLFERSLAAYERSLELEPANPVFLNDTAVILHYYLERDAERALALYAAAEEAAAALCAQGDLSVADREVYETALNDARVNRAKLAGGAAKAEAADGGVD